MEKQDITLSLPKDLLKKAKILADSRHLSLGELMKQLLEEKVMKENGYRVAKNRQLKLMRKGLDLGTRGKIVFSREVRHAGKPIPEILACEAAQTRDPLKDAVQFVGDIVSPVAEKDWEASR